MWRPQDRGRSPRAVQSLRPRQDCTSCSYPSCLGLGGGRVRDPVDRGELQGCVDRSRGGLGPSVWNPRVRGWMAETVRSTRGHSAHTYGLY